FDARCVFLQVDPEAAEIDRTRRAVGERAGGSAIADVDAAIDALIGLGQTAASADDGWRRDVEAAITHRPAAWDRARSSEPGKLHPVEACRPLQRILDRHPESVL